MQEPSNHNQTLVDKINLVINMLREQKASVASIQRRVSVGFNFEVHSEVDMNLDEDERAGMGGIDEVDGEDTSAEPATNVHLASMGVFGVHFVGTVRESRFGLRHERERQLELLRRLKERGNNRKTYETCDVPRSCATLTEAKSMVSCSHWSICKNEARVNARGHTVHRIIYYCKHGGRSLVRKEPLGSRGLCNPDNAMYRCGALLKLVFNEAENIVTLESNLVDHTHLTSRVLFCSGVSKELSRNIANWKRRTLAVLAREAAAESDASQVLVNMVGIVEAGLSSLCSKVQDLIYTLALDTSVSEQNELIMRLMKSIDAELAQWLNATPLRSNVEFCQLWNNAKTSLVPTVSDYLYAFMRKIRGEHIPLTVSQMEEWLQTDHRRMFQSLNNDGILPLELRLESTRPLMLGYWRNIDDVTGSIISQVCTISTPALLRLGMQSCRGVFYLDGTYKLSADGSVLLVLGICDYKKRLWPIAYALATSESTQCIGHMLQHVKDSLKAWFNSDWQLSYAMADGCLALNSAIQTVYPDFDPIQNRGVCYYHVKECIRTKHYHPEMEHLDQSQDNQQLSIEWQAEYLRDVEFLASSRSKAEFRDRTKLFIDKWKFRNRLGIEEMVAPGGYLDVNSWTCNWFAGFLPNGAGRTNNGVERHNRDIKKHITRYQVLPYIRLITYLRSESSFLSALTVRMLNNLASNPIEPESRLNKKHWKRAHHLANSYVTATTIAEDSQMKSVLLALNPDYISGVIPEFDNFLSCQSFWEHHCVVKVVRHELAPTSTSTINCTCKTFLLRSVCEHVLWIGVTEACYSWPDFVIRTGTRNPDYGRTRPRQFYPGDGLRRPRKVVKRVRSSRSATGRRGRPTKIQRISGRSITEPLRDVPLRTDLVHETLSDPLAPTTTGNFGIETVQVDILARNERIDETIHTGQSKPLSSSVVSNNEAHTMGSDNLAPNDKTTEGITSSCSRRVSQRVLARSLKTTKSNSRKGE